MLLQCVRSKKTASNWQSFTPQVQDSDGLSDSKHFDKESRDCLPSSSRENQSEDDHESTDDGLDLFTNHICQHHVSGYVCCVWHLGFWFLLLVEIVSIAKLLIIVHFFWSENMRKKHLAAFTQNLKVIETPFFFSNLFCGSTGFSAPSLKITWAWEVDAPEITWYE